MNDSGATPAAGLINIMTTIGIALITIFMLAMFALITR
jgi:hypothetical protein